MTFETFPSFELQRLAAAGGGFRMDMGLRPIEELEGIARAASRGHARIVMVNAPLRPMEVLVRIAEAGQGAVSFE